MTNQVVTIGYLTAFTNSILTLNTSGYADSYCPTYSELTSGKFFNNWSQGANIKDSTNGIYVEGYSAGTGRTSYSGNQLVVRADLKMKYIVLSSITASRASTNLSCCGANTTVDSTATFGVYVKTEESTSLVTSYTDSTVWFTVAVTSGSAYASVDSTTSSADTHTVTFAKNSTNYNGSVGARSATIKSTYAYSGVTKTATVDITQNSNTYGVSGKTITVSPSSWTSIAPGGGSQTFTATISFVQYDECDSRTITLSSLAPSISSSVAWATVNGNTVTAAAQSKGADSRSGTLTFSYAVPSTYPSVGTISTTGSISQQDNHVISTSYSVSNATASAPSCTESTKTISYTGVTTYTYRDGSTSSSSAALTVTSSSFGTNNSCSTRSVTVSASTSPYGVANAGTKTQGANYTTATAYTVSNAHCSPSSVEYNATATTLYWNGTTKYTYAVEPTSCSTGGTSEYSAAYTFGENTSTAARTLTASTTWNGQSVSATFTQEGKPEECTYTCSDWYSFTPNTSIPATASGDKTLIFSYVRNIKNDGGKHNGTVWYLDSSNILTGVQGSDWTTVSEDISPTSRRISVYLPSSRIRANSTTSERTDVIKARAYHCADTTYSGYDGFTGMPSSVACEVQTITIKQLAGECTVTSVSCSPTAATMSSSSVSTTVTVTDSGGGCGHKWSARYMRTASMAVNVYGSSGDLMTIPSDCVVPQVVEISSDDNPSKKCTFTINAPALDYVLTASSSQANSRSCISIDSKPCQTGSTSVTGSSPSSFNVTYTADTTDTDVRVTVNYSMSNSVSVASLSDIKINSATVAATGSVGTQYNNGSGSYITVRSNNIEIIAPINEISTRFDCTLNLTNGSDTGTLTFGGNLYGIMP